MKCYLKESKLIENKHNRVQQRIKKKREMNKLKKNEEIFPPSTEQLILLYRVRRGSPADPEAILKGK